MTWDFTDHEELLEAAMGVISNVSRGNWDDQTEEWRDAAHTWLKGYQDWLRDKVSA